MRAAIVLSYIEKAQQFRTIRVITSEVMKMMVTTGTTWSDMSTVILMTERTEVLEDLDVPRACTLFTGLMDTLQLQQADISSAGSGSEPKGDVSKE